MKKNTENQPGGEILLYQTEDGKTRLEVQFQGDTVWLSQAQMSELFQTTKQNVSLHIQNIYDEHELERTGTVKESLTVRQEGKRRVSRSVEFYNLDVIISVGYRVKSHRGTQFRIWATQQLREYIIKGFTPEQLRWLEMIRDHIAANLSIEPNDFEYAPFSQQGGLGKVHQLFGDKLNTIIEELNETLAA